MDMQIALMVVRVLLVMAKNLSAQIEAAKKGDGKVTVDELQVLIFQTALKSLDDLEAGGKLSELITSLIKK